MVCVSENSQWNSLTELLEAARTNPETIRFGANLGALSHFGGLQLEQAMPGAKFRYVPTGGGAKRFGDLIGQHIDVSVFNAGEYTHFRDGGLKALAILHPERHAAFPSIPTAKEQGINAVRNSMQYWWAPKNTPPAVIDRFVSLLHDVMLSDTMRQRLDELKMDNVFITGPELRLTLRQRERVMRGVRMNRSIQLPDTPTFIIVTSVLLGLLTFARRRMFARGLITTQASSNSYPATSAPESPSSPRAVVTLAMLLIFAGLFSTGQIPFWLLSTLFITLTGSALINRSRRNMTILLATAVAVGPGCYFVFTRLLTIDLN